MEEILASIRRILNDDDVAAAPAAEEPAAEAPAEDEDVLVLDDSMMVAESDALPEVAAAAPAAEPVAFDPPVKSPMLTAAPAQPARPEPDARASFPAPDPWDQPALTPDLLAPEAAAAAASSVGTLVRTLAAGRATQVYGGGPTLEDMVRAELRPLLKQWLNEHLPPMVERLVRVEIERVVGRGIP
jgi:cell pole-organizing protein PopZ